MAALFTRVQGVGYLFVLALGVAARLPATAQAAPAVDEAQIRAAMVFNLTKYVEWPAWKLVDPSAPFILCFLANDAVGDDIDALVRDRQARESSSQDRKVTVRRVSSLSGAESCHIFYVPKLDKKRLLETLPSMAKASVLTISDSSTPEGAIISLPKVAERVQILVDLRSAQQSQLTLSSKLLRIATVSR